VGPTPLAEGNSLWHLVMLPDEKDLAADPSVQFYHMPAFAYGDAYLGLLGVYHAGPKSGRSEMELTFSRDGLNWHRAAHGEPFIPRGPEGSWDGGFGTVPGSAPLAVGEELWFYYGYNDGTHHNRGKSAIGLAKLRRDGFVSMDAAATGGTVRTKPFALAGAGVVINVKAAGSVTVRLLDEGGKMLAQSESFTGDTCDHPVTWRAAPPWRKLAGQRVKLEFELRDAALYAFEVTKSR
jgi:hypothetical protein